MSFAEWSGTVDGMMSDFVPGIELSRAFYAEAVAPLLTGVPHSAALIGPGSEVLSFDTSRSADHDWGPRVLVFVPDGLVTAVEAEVAAGLPERFRGFATVFDYHGEVRPGVVVAELGEWLARAARVRPAPGHVAAGLAVGAVAAPGGGDPGRRVPRRAGGRAVLAAAGGGPARRCAGIRRTCGVTSWPVSGGASLRRSRSPAAAARWATSSARPSEAAGWPGT